MILSPQQLKDEFRKLNEHSKAEIAREVINEMSDRELIDLLEKGGWELRDYFCREDFPKKEEVKFEEQKIQVKEINIEV